MTNTDEPIIGISVGPVELFEYHRRGYMDALQGRPYPRDYDTFEKTLALNYELGRARCAELRGLRGRGVRWKEGETLKKAVARVCGEEEAARFSRESLELFAKG